MGQMAIMGEMALARANARRYGEMLAQWEALPDVQIIVGTKP
jgi:hypothetical protein